MFWVTHPIIRPESHKSTTALWARFGSAWRRGEPNRRSQAVPAKGRIAHVVRQCEVVGVGRGPQASRTAEVGYRRFGRNAGAGEDKDPVGAVENRGGSRNRFGHVRDASPCGGGDFRAQAGRAPRSCSRRIWGWRRRSHPWGIGGNAVATCICPASICTRRARTSWSRWAGLGRERPRRAAVASRRRSATAPGPRSADQHRMATVWVSGYPIVMSGTGWTRGLCCAVRRRGMGRFSAAPEGGAGSIAMGGRTS